MNSKLSIWKLLLAGAGVGLLVTNCTIKSSDDGAGGDNGTAATGNFSSGSCTAGHKLSGCTCPGNLVGYQVCGSDGTYAQSCVCPAVGEGGAPAENGGASSVGGSATSGGYSGSTVVGEAGSADAGAAGVAGLHIDPTDCSGCLTQLCAMEWAACQAEDENNPLVPPDAPDEYCFGSDKKPDTGQFELITDCITMARASGIANREAVRACGASIGVSSNPADNPAFSSWPPPQMSPATEELMNCMADLPNPPMPMPGAWATDPTNFPDGAPPKPWDDGTCAKLSCTSKLTP